MKLKILFIINAIFFLLNGLCTLLIPATVLSLYGVTPGAEQNLMGQYAGLGSVAIGLVAWFSGNTKKSEAKRTIVPAFFIYFVMGVIVSAAGTLSGVMGTIGWSLVLIYLLFAIAYGYFLIRR